jgi:hypothetical protein
VVESGGRPDLAEEALGPEARAQLGVEHLDRHEAVVPQVAGEIHRGHAAVTELALDRVAAGQGGFEVFQGLGQRETCLVGVSPGLAGAPIRPDSPGDCYRFSGQKRSFRGGEAGTDAR